MSISSPTPTTITRKRSNLTMPCSSTQHQQPSRSSGVIEKVKGENLSLNARHELLKKKQSKDTKTISLLKRKQRNASTAQAKWETKFKYLKENFSAKMAEYKEANKTQ